MRMPQVMILWRSEQMVSIDVLIFDVGLWRADLQASENGGAAIAGDEHD